MMKDRTKDNRAADLVGKMAAEESVQNLGEWMIWPCVLLNIS